MKKTIFNQSINSHVNPVDEKSKEQAIEKYSFKWIIYLFIAALSVAIISLIINIITPPKTQINETEFITKNLDQSQTEFQNIIFEGNEIKIPKKLPIMEVEEKEFLNDYIKNQIIEEYQLQLTQQNIWQGDDYNFTYIAEGQYYSLINKYLKKTTKKIVLSDALDKADSIISKYFSSLQLLCKKEDIKFLASGHHLQEVPKDQADLLIIPYTYLIENIPVYYQKASFYPFQITINADNQLVKLNFQDFYYIFQTKSYRELISVNEALENINHNQASIIFAQQTQVEPLSIETLKSGTLNEVSLEYRIDDQQKLAFPFYRFKGKLINNLDTTLEAEIITPAIETTQNKSN